MVLWEGDSSPDFLELKRVDPALNSRHFMKQGCEEAKQLFRELKRCLSDPSYPASQIFFGGGEIEAMGFRLPTNK